MLRGAEMTTGNDHRASLYSIPDPLQWKRRILPVIDQGRKVEALALGEDTMIIGNNAGEIAINWW